MKGIHVGTARRNGLSALALAMALAWQSAWATSVTLNLKDADLSALIGTVAEVTGTNFIVDPRVKGKVTVVSSKPMESDEVYQVFLSILKVHGYAAVPSGSVVKIVPDVNAKAEGVPSATDKEPGRGDEVVTRVIEVNNVSAAQLVPILRPLVPQQGHMAAYPGTNVLIISDRAENIERLVSIVRRMDQQSDNEIEVMPLQYASAAEVVRIIGALNKPQPGIPQAAGNEASVIADERTNSVLIGGDKADRLRLRMVISHLDTPLERGGNTHVIYLKYAKAEDLVKVLTGVSTSIAQEQKGGAQAAGGGGGGGTRAQSGELSIQADEAANALVINAAPDVYRSLESVIRQLDIRRAQVHVEAVIAEINTDKTMELGVQWRGTDGLNGAGAIGGTNFTGVGAGINDVAANPLASGAGLSVGYFEGTTKILGKEILNLGVLVKALASDSDTNILSTPNLVTLDNQEAEIVVAQNVPFVTGSYSSTGAAEGATNPFQTIQREDVGLKLKVKPQINEGDAIKLEIEQEISSVGVKPQDAADIFTNKRSIKTSVMVDDKQMIVLGGLIDDNLTETVQKVPLLGDLPVLGNLFKARKTNKTKRNLMVFLQPSILRDAAYTNEVSSGKYSFMRGLQTQMRDKGVNLMSDDEAPLLPDYPPVGNDGAGNASAPAETQPLPEAPAPVNP
ncbi:MAG: type II secretion system secretin GspD [Gammaproteobacteria bacterium]|nr:type II secretion system secretin GspD [Gammaproteobacteria bacterium]